ncbi:hypothetical protein DAT36_19210 [Photobacterium phosphoreum]|nr:hypothetical protein DAT36_19210 [Photobacterium phosphoreum]
MATLFRTIFCKFVCGLFKDYMVVLFFNTVTAIIHRDNGNPILPKYKRLMYGIGDYKHQLARCSGQIDYSD